MNVHLHEEDGQFPSHPWADKHSDCSVKTGGRLTGSKAGQASREEAPSLNAEGLTQGRGDEDGKGAAEPRTIP